MNRCKKKILIIMVAGIGDFVMASKSIRAIRNGNPDADIHFLTNSEAAPIAQNYRYIDHVWSFPIREMRKDKRYLVDVVKLVLKLRKMKFDLAVNLYAVSSFLGALRMGSLFLLLGAKRSIGHDSKGFGLFIDEKVPVGTFQNRHFTDAMLDVALLAGGVSDKKNIEVFWNEECEKKWEDTFLKETYGAQPLIVGINPGGDSPDRRWSPRNFATLADSLIDESGARIIILGGPGEENIGNEIQQRMRNNALNLSGKLGLNDLVYIISRLDLLMTNDSGPMHIGAATGTPLVAIFGPSDPTLMRPYTADELYRVIYKGLDCQPCNNEKCTQRICLNTVTPEEVYKKCVELLHLPGSM